jgi:hypothetical protein
MILVENREGGDIGETLGLRPLLSINLHLDSGVSFMIPRGIKG